MLWRVRHGINSERIAGNRSSPEIPMPRGPNAEVDAALTLRDNVFHGGREQNGDTDWGIRRSGGSSHRHRWQ